MTETDIRVILIVSAVFLLMILIVFIVARLAFSRQSEQPEEILRPCCKNCARWQYSDRYPHYGACSKKKDMPITPWDHCCIQYRERRKFNDDDSDPV